MCSYTNPRTQIGAPSLHSCEVSKDLSDFALVHGTMHSALRKGKRWSLRESFIEASSILENDWSSGIENLIVK